MRPSLFALIGVAACGAATTEPTPRRHVPSYHIDSPDDVRWPAVRTMFVGTVRIERHGARSVLALELDADPAGPTARPPLIALHGASPELRAQLSDGSRACVSGIGRIVERDEAAIGAVISLDDVQREPDIAAPQVSAYPLLRHEADLSVLLAQTYVTSEGIVVERNGGFLLQLPSGAHVRLRVTACDGEAVARAQVGKRRHVYGLLSAERDEDAPSDVVPTMAIGFPTFE